MSTIYGWAGKILRVNFTTGAITTEDTLPKYHDYVGGMGIGYKIIWDEVPMETKAYDEASKVVIAVGPLTASGVPCSGRTNISFLSSWSKGYSIVDAHMGGHIAHNIKFAGYDAIVLKARARPRFTSRSRMTRFPSRMPPICGARVRLRPTRPSPRPAAPSSTWRPSARRARTWSTCPA